jgi:uncharacterized protein involved in oxidation of intracellular sulfur
MKLGIIIYSSDPETVWNALRLAGCALMNKDKVEIFLLGGGVDIDSIHSGQFDVQALVFAVKSQDGKMMACGTCVKGRGKAEYGFCDTSQGMECYQLIKDCDKVLTF